MSIGTFVLVKNEAPWIAAHILRVLPHMDQMVFFDGWSQDGTIEIIEAVRAQEPGGDKIKLYRGQDPKDLQNDYVRLFDEALRSLDTDLAFFLHPDMWIENPGRLSVIRNSGAIALSTRIRSFAGEPGGELLEIVGRAEAWKNIYRLRNPDLGAHYWGHYGAANEDVYFREITGDAHEHHGQDFAKYPYAVEDSGLNILHFSDVRPLERRLGRMKSCLLNQGYPKESVDQLAATHARVTFKDGMGLTFKPAQYPAEFLAAQQKYAHLRREAVCA